MLSISGYASNEDKDAKDSLVLNDHENQLFKMRHSAAHVLAQAVIERFSDAGRIQLGAGPAIASGFYYDFNLPRPLQDDDIQWLENRMKEIVRGEFDFRQSFVNAEKAREMFKQQPFKLELIDLIANGIADDNALDVPQDAEEDGSPEVSVFQHDQFVDLCKGPHVGNSREINPDGIKLLHSAGSFWRANERNPMLTRIYGTVFPSKEELDRHLEVLEEIKRRDHRRIGKRLELFHFDETAQGMPYWLPNGMKVLNELLAYWREVHEELGYEEISSPLLNNKKLWEISGHWDHYQDNMFLVELDDDTVYGLKPMNCPNAMVVFGLKLRSYRDLPMRLADCDILHRHERSGTLSGLFRVQKFQQDDAHIFVAYEQVEEEFNRILDLADQFYKIFNLSYSFRLGLRPDKFVGDPAVWDRAENALKDILNRRVGEDNYVVAEKEGAFYGPKIDILMKDSLGRKWQMGTIQLDFNLPKLFGLKYIDSDGQAKPPAVIHRVIYGSIDRFIGILLEHTNGDLPLWLAPLHVVLVPIADRHIEYAETIRRELRKNGVRCKIDQGNARMNRKIRDWELQKVPHIAIIGDKEAESKTVSLRSRGDVQKQGFALDSFIEQVSEAIRNRA